MKRKVLTFFNIILGVLATIFAGCHAQKKVAPEPEPVCMYAGPGQMGELNVRMDQEQIDKDTLVTEQEVVEPQENTKPYKPQPVKYGPRPQ
ncbi:MAG: hypothetical protein IJ920_07815 [Paludibacteraceae bacterium]|jgi:hypothetical protein|nr:hypothetical protein [Paludibacteraceae bacterium]